MTGDYHLQTNIDMRVLATIAAAKAAQGYSPRSLAQMTRDILEEYALNLVVGGAQGIGESELAEQVLAQLRLIRPNSMRFRAHLRNIGEQQGFSAHTPFDPRNIPGPWAQGMNEPDFKDKIQRTLAVENQTKLEPNEDMVKAFREARDRVNTRTGLSANDRERIRQSPHIIAQTDEDEDGVGDNETPDQQRLRREREHQETLRVLRDSGEAPLESPLEESEK